MISFFKKTIWIDKLKFENISIMNKTHEKRQGRENKMFKNCAK